MMHVYISKFNNDFVMNEYRDTMKKTLTNVLDENNKGDGYTVFLRIVETVSLYIGIRENISDKLAEELFYKISKKEA